MPNRLIIVESPSKARTLAKFLGPDVTVKASMGHVRDLPKSRLGVDLESGFAPEYEVTKEAQVKELRAAARKADSVLLASDPDREGEAIAWHLAEALSLRDPDRIVFHEITKPAVEAALGHPRKIDRNLVSAQEARRVIDRLVGYQLSPLLWKKVRAGTSAGRVQSVAVRLVVDREKEIEAFSAEESWSLEATLEKDDGATVVARLHARVGDPEADAGAPAADGTGPEGAPAEGVEQDTTRLKLGTEAEALAVIAALGLDEQGRPTERTPRFRVASVEARDTSRSAPAPYTTSTLQQDANTRLRMSPKRTMAVAQQLYEGVDVGEGATGLITYMRTDSTRVSELAHHAAVEHITGAYGAEYVRKGANRRAQKTAVHAQEAHEAIRPTDVTRTPESVAQHLDRDQARLYELIWRRFVASEMAAARFQNTRVDVHAADYVFRASGSVLRFDGYTRVLRRDDREERTLPPLSVDELLACLEMKREQHFTQPPPRYTEASLIKELEERGIGRPSTYAPTIEVIQERRYVRQEERRLHPTELGRTVDGVLREHFPDIVDVAFTAEMEKRLDRIEEGKRRFEPTVRDWYDPFATTLARAEKTMERVLVGTGETCPECGEGELVIRRSRFGDFVGCSRYPECRYIKREASAPPQPTGESCPECGRELVVRQGKRGPFVGCSGYPECKYIRGDVAADGTPAQPEEDLGSCPECGRPLGRKRGRRGPFVGCTGYPECRYIQPRTGAPATGSGAGRTPAPPPEPTGEDCPECGKPLVVRQGRYGPFTSCSGYPKCRFIKREPKGQGGRKAAAGSDAAPVEVDPELGTCPECGKPMVRRTGRHGAFVACSGYPACRFVQRRSRGAGRDADIDTAQPAAVEA